MTTIPPVEGAISPGTDVRPTLVHNIESITERLDYQRLFVRQQPVEVELGSGDGSFLAQYAAQHRDRNFLGVERLLGRLRKLDRKGLRNGLENLRLVRIEAGYLTEYLLPRDSAAALHVYFPDPWPKRKHHKYRLINERFTELAHQALQPGGVIYLRTDHSGYFAQMTEVFGQNRRFTVVDTPPELAETITDFEREFHRRGVTTLRAAYRRD